MVKHVKYQKVRWHPLLLRTQKILHWLVKKHWPTEHVAISNCNSIETLLYIIVSHCSARVIFSRKRIE